MSRPVIAVDLRALVPEPAGIGVYTQAMLEALARRGRATYVGMAHAPVHGREALAAAGVEVEVEPAPLGIAWQQWRLPRRLARGDVDLLWSPLFTLPLRLPVPGVVTVHDLTAVLYPQTHSLKVRLSQGPLLRRSLKKARFVVADSEATAGDLRAYEPACAEKLRVVPAGVDPAFRPAAEDEVRAIRDELGCPRGYVLHVGTLEPRKNVDTLLDAWEALREKDPATPPLLLAGSSGWRNAALTLRIESLGRSGVRHLGRLPFPELVRLYQGALAFAFPSLYEGFGLPPLEAMACGVPVVASNASSLPEVVGDAGLLVDPRDSEALAAALGRILREPDLARDLSERGSERARAFTWERAAEALESVLLEALAH